MLTVIPYNIYWLLMSRNKQRAYLINDLFNIADGALSVTQCPKCVRAGVRDYNKLEGWLADAGRGETICLG